MRRTFAILAAAALAVTGVAGVSLIQEFEGKSNAAYIDPVGIPTICYGHTGPEVRRGLTYTDAQCTAILHEDIRVHRAGLNRCIRRNLNSNQWAALTSLAFNIGVNRTCGSTLVRYVNAGNFPAASAQFGRWVYAGGRRFRGLERRRAAEKVLFDTPELIPQ